MLKAQLFCNGHKESLKDFQSLLSNLNFAVLYIKIGRWNLSPLHKFTTYFSNERTKHVPVDLFASLEFWTKKSSYTPVPIHNLIRSPIKVSYDASQQGWGAYITWSDDTHSSIQEHWDSTWASEHINIKELWAALFALQHNPKKLANHPVTFYSDNKATVQWINKGTSVR